MQSATILAMANPENSKCLVSVQVEADICKKIAEVTHSFFHNYQQSDDGVFIDHALWSSPHASNAIEGAIKFVLKMHEHPDVTEDMIYRLSLPWNNLRYHILNVITKMEELETFEPSSGSSQEHQNGKQLRNTVMRSPTSSSKITPSKRTTRSKQFLEPICPPPNTPKSARFKKRSTTTRCGTISLSFGRMNTPRSLHKTPC